MRKVTTPCKEIRKQARVALTGKWISTWILTFIATILPSFLLIIAEGFLKPLATLQNMFEDGDFLSIEYYNLAYDKVDTLNYYSDIGLNLAIVGVIVGIFLTGPLQLGISKVHLDIQRGHKATFKTLFYAFGNSKLLFKSIGLNIFIFFFILLWTVPILAFGMMLAANLFLFDLGAIMMFYLIWLILSIIPGIIAYIRYSMAHYIMVDNPDIKIREMVNQSKEMMKDNIGKYFKLNLSFIGWYILFYLAFALLAVISHILGLMGSVDELSDMVNYIVSPQFVFVSILLGVLLVVIVQSFVEVYRKMSCTVFYVMAKGDDLIIDKQQQQINQWHNVGLVNNQDSNDNVENDIEEDTLKEVESDHKELELEVGEKEDQNIDQENESDNKIQ